MELIWEKKLNPGELIHLECLDHTLGVQTETENPGDCHLYLSGMVSKLDENYLTIVLVRYYDESGIPIRADTFKVIKTAITRIWKLPKLVENCLYDYSKEG